MYGFVFLDEQECEIIDHPAFQRLRRIKQLSLTDMVYPGANHTRFEHSIGVMQMATDMFGSIVAKKQEFLKKERGIDESGIRRWEKIVRLAALLHDVGHAPFSHSGEGLMPLLPQGHRAYEDGEQKRYEHEEYSIAIIKSEFRAIIEDHPLNSNFGIRVGDVTALLGDGTVNERFNFMSLLLKDLISGQLDADRSDYLLRDSLHLGVNYGMYDRNRLVSCMTIGKTEETEAPVLAIEVGGWHIAESLVIARYQMFSQVYFHKVRRIYDHHIACATKEILKEMGHKDGMYPPPDNMQEYLKFDDWTMYCGLQNGWGGEHGSAVLNRAHYKCKAETGDNPSEEELQEIQRLLQQHKDTKYFLDDKASTSWYKIEKDIQIENNGETRSLSEKSSIVKAMMEKPRLQRLYIKR